MPTVNYLLFSDLYPGVCPTTTIDSNTTVNSFLTNVMKGKNFYRDDSELFFYNGANFILLTRDKESGSSFNPNNYDALQKTYTNIPEKGESIIGQLEGENVLTGVFYVNSFNQTKDEAAAKKCLPALSEGGRRRRPRKSCKRKRSNKRRRGSRRIRRSTRRRR
jgi:hypothetical protein